MKKRSKKISSDEDDDPIYEASEDDNEDDDNDDDEEGDESPPPKKRKIPPTTKNLSTSQVKTSKSHAPVEATEFVQCTSCMKWRKLLSVTVDSLPENWTCKLNGDPFHNKCSAPEETPEDSIPLGKKTKKEDNRTLDQKQKDLLDDIGSSRDKFSRTDRKKRKRAKGNRAHDQW